MATEQQKSILTATVISDMQQRRLALGRKESRPDDWSPPNPDAVRQRKVRNRIEDIMAARAIGIDVGELA